MAQTCGAHQGARAMSTCVEASRDLQMAGKERDEDEDEDKGRGRQARTKVRRGRVGGVGTTTSRVSDTLDVRVSPRCGS